MFYIPTVFVQNSVFKTQHVLFELKQTIVTFDETSLTDQELINTEIVEHSFLFDDDDDDDDDEQMNFNVA